MNAIFVTYDDSAAIQAVAQLNSTRKINPVYWVASRRIQDQLLAAFPGVIFHERQAAVRGVKPNELIGLAEAPLDGVLLGALAEWEVLALAMMERMDSGDSFPYRERVAHYHRLVRYWNTILSEMRPEIVFFFSAPHFVYDFVLYALCRHYEVPVAFFRHTSLPGLSLFVDGIEDGHRRLAAAYELALESDLPIQLSVSSARYLSRIRGDYGLAEPDYMRGQRKYAANLFNRALIPRNLGDIRNRLRGIGGVIRGKPAQTILKVRGKPVSKVPSLMEFGLAKARGVVRQRWQRAQYENIAAAPEENQPSIFCALHFQPERTTSPDGGVFVHQLLLVDLLARTVPSGWRVYVKEHPTQFVPETMFDSSSAQLRSAEFYKALSAMPNVHPVHVNTPSYELLDTCMAVATVSGTIGWEALSRGKPALVFGYPWYLGCRGAFHIRSATDLVSAIQSIGAGSHPTEDEVDVFASVAEANAFRGIFGQMPSTVDGSDEDGFSVRVEEYQRAFGQALDNIGGPAPAKCSYSQDLDG